MESNIYLAKKGKITGPLTTHDYENLKLSGQIEDFFWIWNVDMKQWIPLDPPPPPPTSAPNEQHSTQVLPIRPAFQFGQVDSIEVLAHNFREIVQGKIEEPTEIGFKLRAQADHHSPKLGSQGQVVLNFLNQKNGEMVTVPGEITGVTRVGDGWSYQVRWSQLPRHFFK